MFDPLDLFWQALAGNWVAWFAISLTGVVLVLICSIIIAWHFLPQYARAGLINNTVGHNRPTIAELYENKRLVFRLPQLLRSGLGYLKGVWFIFPKAWALSQEELTKAERDLVNSVCTIEGSQSAFYFNLSVQAQVVNPEMLAVIQHQKELQSLVDGQVVKVKKSLFFEALKQMKDDYVQLQPMHLEYPTDIKELRTMLPKSLSKSELAEQENRIRQDVREEKGGFNLQIVLVLIGVVSVILGIVTLLKLFGVF